MLAEFPPIISYVITNRSFFSISFLSKVRQFLPYHWIYMFATFKISPALCKVASFQTLGFFFFNSKRYILRLTRVC